MGSIELGFAFAVLMSITRPSTSSKSIQPLTLIPAISPSTLQFDCGGIDGGRHVLHVLCNQRFSYDGELFRVFRRGIRFARSRGSRLETVRDDALRWSRSSRVSTFWAKFSPSAEWTALPRAMFAVAGSGTFKPYLNHQRIWQSMKRTLAGEELRMNRLGIRA